jgi:DNA-binding PadR family transcriptional regulator
VLELAILGLLIRGPLHGYDLRRRLRDGFGSMAHLSFGSLYPALARLEMAGAVRVVTDGDAPARLPRATPSVAPPLLPLTGSLTGERAAHVARRATAKAAVALGSRSTRSRKVYEITATGQHLFEQLLESPAANGDETRAFSLRLSFASHLAPEARVRLLERHRAHLAESVDRARRHVATAPDGLDHYERVVAEHALDALELDLAWTEVLLAEEHRHAPAPTVGAVAPGRAARDGRVLGADRPGSVPEPDNPPVANERTDR